MSHPSALAFCSVFQEFALATSYGALAFAGQFYRLGESDRGCHAGIRHDTHATCLRTPLWNPVTWKSINPYYTCYWSKK